MRDTPTQRSDGRAQRVYVMLTVVFMASMGIKKMRKPAEAADAANVFTATGSVLVESYESSSANVPLLAAVSPKRDSGPCAACQRPSVGLSLAYCMLAETNTCCGVGKRRPSSAYTTHVGCSSVHTVHRAVQCRLAWNRAGRRPL